MAPQIVSAPRQRTPSQSKTTASRDASQRDKSGVASAESGRKLALAAISRGGAVVRRARDRGGEWEVQAGELLLPRHSGCLCVARRAGNREWCKFLLRCPRRMVRGRRLGAGRAPNHADTTCCRPRPQTGARVARQRHESSTHSAPANLRRVPRASRVRMGRGWGGGHCRRGMEQHRVAAALARWPLARRPM